MKPRRRSLVLWSSLLVAFSPVIHDLGISLVANPEQRYVLAPMVLAVLALAQECRYRSSSRPILGSGVVAIGLVAELVGIASSSWFIARIGFPISIFGTGLILGHRVRFSIPLLVATIPVPEFIVYSTSPFLESMLARWAGNAINLVGGSLEVGGPLFTSKGLRLELSGYDSGVVTAILLAVAGWYGAFRAGRRWADCAGRSLASASLVLLLQPFLVVASATTLLLGYPALGGLLLKYGLATALGLWMILRFPDRVLRSAAPRSVAKAGEP